MNLMPEQDQQYAKVDAYVRKSCKTWFMTNKQKWNSCITILMDIQEYGRDAESSIRNLVNRIWNYSEAREKILSLP